MTDEELERYAAQKDWLGTESQYRQHQFRQYMMHGKLYVRLELDPFGSRYCPAVNGTPAEVARWLRGITNDIEALNDPPDYEPDEEPGDDFPMEET